MTLVVGPLFSLDASGKFGKSLIYGKNQGGNWVRPPLHRKKAVSERQLAQRNLFLAAKGVYSAMTDEERQLWYSAVHEDHLNSGLDYYRYKRSGLCLFMSEALNTGEFEWGNCPFPPLLPRLNADYALVDINTYISAIETYTVLSFCEMPSFWFFEKLGLYVSSLHPDYGDICYQIPSSQGTGLAILKSYWDTLDTDGKIEFQLQNLVFLLISQHRYFYSINMIAAWEMAVEITDDILSGSAIPPYEYNGTPLVNLVPNPLCTP